MQGRVTVCSVFKQVRYNLCNGRKGCSICCVWLLLEYFTDILQDVGCAGSNSSFIAQQQLLGHHAVVYVCGVFNNSGWKPTTPTAVAHVRARLGYIGQAPWRFVFFCSFLSCLQSHVSTFQTKKQEACTGGTPRSSFFRRKINQWLPPFFFIDIETASLTVFKMKFFYLRVTWLYE